MSLLMFRDWRLAFSRAGYYRHTYLTAWGDGAGRQSFGVAIRRCVRHPAAMRLLFDAVKLDAEDMEALEDLLSDYPHEQDVRHHPLNSYKLLADRRREEGRALVYATLVRARMSRIADEGTYD